jgi:hypothetical protein
LKSPHVKNTLSGCVKSVHNCTLPGNRFRTGIYASLQRISRTPLRWCFPVWPNLPVGKLQLNTHTPEHHPQVLERSYCVPLIHRLCRLNCRRLPELAKSRERDSRQLETGVCHMTQDVGQALWCGLRLAYGYLASVFVVHVSNVERWRRERLTVQ